MNAKKQNKAAVPKKKQPRSYSAVVKSTVPASRPPTQKTPVTTSKNNLKNNSIPTVTSGTNSTKGLNYPALKYASSSESFGPRTDVTFDCTSKEGFVPPPNFGAEPQYSQERIYGPKTGETIDYSTNSTLRRWVKPNKLVKKPSELNSTPLTSSVFGLKQKVPSSPFDLQTQQTDPESWPQYSLFDDKYKLLYDPQILVSRHNTTEQHATQPEQQNTDHHLTQSSQQNTQQKNSPSTLGSVDTSSFTSPPNLSKIFNVQNPLQHTSKYYEPESFSQLKSLLVTESSSSPAQCTINTFDGQYNQESNFGYDNSSYSLISTENQGLKSKNTTKNFPYANFGYKASASCESKLFNEYRQASKQPNHDFQQNVSSILYTNNGTSSATELPTFQSGVLGPQQQPFSELYSSTIQLADDNLRQNSFSDTNVYNYYMANPTTLQSEAQVSQQYIDKSFIELQPNPQFISEGRANESNDTYYPIPLPPKYYSQPEFNGQQGYISESNSVFVPNQGNFMPPENSAFVHTPNRARTPSYLYIPQAHYELDSQSVPSASNFQNFTPATQFNFEPEPVPPTWTSNFDIKAFFAKFAELTETVSTTSTSGFVPLPGPSIGSLPPGNAIFDQKFDLKCATQLYHAYDTNRNNPLASASWSINDGEASSGFKPGVSEKIASLLNGDVDLYNLLYPCPSISPHETRDVIWKLAHLIKGDNLLNAIKMLMRMVNQELLLPFPISCKCYAHRTYLQVIPAAYMLDYLLRATTTYRSQNVNVGYVFIEHLEVILFDDDDNFPLCRIQMYTRVGPSRLPQAFM